MSNPRKPKSNAVLKNLPAERQQQVAEWCEKANDTDPAGHPVPKTGGLEFARAQLAADGVSVALNTVSEFYRWFSLRRTFALAESQAQQAEEFLRRQFPDATPAKIAAAGQLVFTMQAANAGDAETFRAMETLRLAKTTAEHNAAMDKARLEQKERQIAQKDRDLSLVERRVKLLEAKQIEAREALTKVATAKGGLSPAALKEIERIAKILG